jgi:hypothetical protein
MEWINVAMMELNELCTLRSVVVLLKGERIGKKVCRGLFNMLSSNLHGETNENVSQDCRCPGLESNP